MSSLFTESDKKFLLDVARKTIISRSKKIGLSENEIEQLAPYLKEKKGCFVTLTIEKQLRGCIGYILPVVPLYKAVIENAYNAAYGDPRFTPLGENEFDKIKIEISVLSVPKKLQYSDKDDLLKKLKAGEDGVIIKKGYYSSTFLPQVWEQLPDKKSFLMHLCMKAGLSPDEWKTGDLEVDIYKSEAFEEHQA